MFNDAVCVFSMRLWRLMFNGCCVVVFSMG